jgi:cyclic pyranopterin phosphate synthase
LKDGFGRRIEYLRLSVTDRCNFSCVYCLPDGCPRGSSALLSAVEIERLARAFAGLGVWKVRLTGGEPTTRQDLVGLVGRIAGIPGIRRVGLTTNGYLLARIAGELKAAGLTSLNVSVDSLDPERFERLTGFPHLDRIIAGVEAALAAGIPSVKVNAVLLKGFPEQELDRFLAWTRDVPLSVRFIELMQTGDNGEFFREHHLPAEEVRRELEARGWATLSREASDGPAAYYGRAGHAGRVGLIAPYSKGFCHACNRVRVSSTGDLRLCLFGGEQIPLRPLLQADDQADELSRLIASSIGAKPESHRLQQGRFGATTNLAITGG